MKKKTLGVIQCNHTKDIPRVHKLQNLHKATACALVTGVTAPQWGT